MPPMTLPDLVRRRFVHYTARRGLSAAEVVRTIGLPPVVLCHLIAGQKLSAIPLSAYAHIAAWLQMPLRNVLALAGVTPSLAELMRLGMEWRGLRATSACDQVQAAGAAGVSVAVFRRALHGYADFRPSARTCERLAAWLGWTGLNAEDIATAAGVVMCYRPDGRRVTVARDMAQALAPYPCACGRPGCLVPAHVPAGPRRKWRSDACRMWAKRRGQGTLSAALPHPTPIVRFIVINERAVPVRF